MENREMIKRCFSNIDKIYSELKKNVDNSSDQQLEDILDGAFSGYAESVIIALFFLKMIITRKEEKEFMDQEKTNMSNDELIKSFNSYQYFLFPEHF